MEPLDPKQTLWANVSALMSHHWGRENLTRLAAEAKIGPGSATRIKERKTSVGIDIVGKVAAVFELQAWHLLTPNLDPSNPPVIHVNQREAELYRRWKADMRELLNSAK